MAVVELANNIITFECPGCGDYHVINIDPNRRGQCWNFNNNLESPTLKPSILVKTGCHSKNYDPKDSCWCKLKAEGKDDYGFTCVTCHSYVTNGQIQFLNDSTHELSGKTVPLKKIIES